MKKTLGESFNIISISTTVTLCCVMLLQGLNRKHMHNHRGRLWQLKAYIQAFVDFSSGHLPAFRHLNAIFYLF